MPGTIGAIDGKLIKIPGLSEHRCLYKSQGFPSVQLQVVFNKSMQILNVLLGGQGQSMTVGFSTIHP